MKFGSEKNIISIIQNALTNYEKYLLNKSFLYVYFNDIENKYEYTEVIFKKEHFKHLCGISSDSEDIKIYINAKIPKEVVTAKDFFNLCKSHKLGERHIILKRDGTTVQKMNIVNNLFKIVRLIQQKSTHSSKMLLNTQ